MRSLANLIRLSALMFLLISNSLSAQVPVSSGIFNAKEFSKDIAWYQAKAFIMKTVLAASGEVIGFQIDPLVAASSGELTSFSIQMPGQRQRWIGFRILWRLLESGRSNI